MAISFSKQEHAILPRFRQRISGAESDVDVSKFFGYSVKELLGEVLGEEVFVTDEDIELTPASEPFFRLRGSLLGYQKFADIWESSDMPSIISRMAETASHRITHLRSNQLKTNAKFKRH